MESTEQARAVAERYCAAWAANDLDEILGCYADTFTLHYFGSNPYTGDHIGRDAALATLLAVGAKAPRTLIEVEQILAGPDAAVMVVVEDIVVDGATHSIRRVLRFRIEGDQFIDCWLYDEDQSLIDQAWSANDSPTDATTAIS